MKIVGWDTETDEGYAILITTEDQFCEPKNFSECIDTIIRQVNFIGHLVSEFSAFARLPIPIFSQKLLESRESGRKFSGEVLTLLFIVLVLLTLIMQAAMPYLMVVIAPGFYEVSEKYVLAILLCRITTPYLIFISITAILGGILNSVKNFAAFAFTPVIMNVCVILFTYFLYGYH